MSIRVPGCQKLQNDPTMKRLTLPLEQLPANQLITYHYQHFASKNSAKVSININEVY